VGVTKKYPDFGGGDKDIPWGQRISCLGGGDKDIQFALGCMLCISLT
jgi:hypothetical protein